MSDNARYIQAAALILAAVVWHFVIFRLAPRLRLVKANFKNTRIMSSYGIPAYGFAAAVTSSLALVHVVNWREAALYLWVMGAMCVLGALDDIFGSRECGGFAGHFKKLFREGVVTTGAVKAMGGGAVGVWAGWLISGGDAARWIAAALLIPLAANTLNLLDLRPGRAVALFILGVVVTCLSVPGSVGACWILVGTAVVALGFGVADSLGKAMMGDSGSNMFGSALGLAIALNGGLWFQIGAIVFFTGIHLYSEKYSISGLIERNAVLRTIDRRLGVR